MQKKLFIYSALLGGGIFIVNALANTFFWYVSIPQFDMVMHTLGGVFLAIWGAALLYPMLAPLKPALWMIVLLAFVLIFGFLWEVFEFSVQGLMQVETLANIPDSLSDMVFDFLGGIIGTLFAIVRTKRYNTIND